MHRLIALAVVVGACGGGNDLPDAPQVFDGHHIFDAGRSDARIFDAPVLPPDAPIVVIDAPILPPDAPIVTIDAPILPPDAPIVLIDAAPTTVALAPPTISVVAAGGTGIMTVSLSQPAPGGGQVVT